MSKRVNKILIIFFFIIFFATTVSALIDCCGDFSCLQPTYALCLQNCDCGTTSTTTTQPSCSGECVSIPCWRGGWPSASGSCPSGYYCCDTSTCDPSSCANGCAYLYSRSGQCVVGLCEGNECRCHTWTCPEGETCGSEIGTCISSTTSSTTSTTSSTTTTIDHQPTAPTWIFPSAEKTDCKSGSPDITFDTTPTISWTPGTDPDGEQVITRLWVGDVFEGLCELNYTDWPSKWEIISDKQFTTQTSYTLSDAESLEVGKTYLFYLCSKDPDLSQDWSKCDSGYLKVADGSTCEACTNAGFEWCDSTEECLEDCVQTAQGGQCCSSGRLIQTVLPGPIGRVCSECSPAIVSNQYCIDNYGPNWYYVPCTIGNCDGRCITNQQDCGTSELFLIFRYLFPFDIFNK